MTTLRHRTRPLGWFALAMLLGFMPSLASANTFTPAPGTADGAPGSLRDAISQANSNGEDDTITLSAGTYSLTLAGSGEDANASGDLDITEAGFSVIIEGAGRTSTFIDQDTADRVIQVFAGATVTFRDLTILGGRVSTSGGGIMNSGGDVTLNSTEVTDNQAAGPAATDGGGGIYNNGGAVSIVNRSTVRLNNATGASGSGGGIFNAAGGTLFIEQSRIARNRANRAGGGIEDASDTGMMRAASGGLAFAVELRNVDLNNNIAGPSGNAAPGNGGGLHVTGNANVSILAGTVRNNTAAREGGGVWNDAGTMVIDRVSISGNTAAGPAADDGGGGVFNNGGLVDIDGGSITENKATGASGSGGGIHNRGILEVTDTMISSNTANRAGGGIEDTGAALDKTSASGIFFTTALDNVTLANNNGGMAPGNGGGLHSGGGLVFVGGSAVTGNIAVEGGGLWGSGLMDIEGTTISGNTATGDLATKGGGGIFNQAGEVELTDSMVMNNDATGTSGSGGGAFNSGGFFRIDGTTFSGNTAQRAGGGIEDIPGLVTKTFKGGGAGMYITDTTLDGNDAGANPGNGGGLHSGGGFVEYESGTVINNTAIEGGGLWTSGEMLLGDRFFPCELKNGGGPCEVPQSRGGARLNIANNIASGDAADNGGGGVFNQAGFVSASSVSVVGNMATGTSGSGGGLFNNGGFLEIANAVIADNSANRAGGGIEDVGGSSKTVAKAGIPGTFVSNTVISGNDAGSNPGNGGGVHSGGGFVNISSGIVTNNTAVEGGGLWTSGTMEVGDGLVIWSPLKSGLPSGNVDVTNNTATGDDADQGGGGIYNQGGDITVRASMVGMNEATGASGSGGGILNNNGSLTVNNSMIAMNTANRAGGGIEDVSVSATKAGGPDVTIDESIIVGNNAGASPGNGGGIHIGGPGNMAITRSSVNDNTAVEGGGVWNSGAGTVSITMTNVDSNTATRGGGVYQSGSGGTMFVDQSLLQFNVATSGGGGQTEGGDVTMTNSTLSGNTAVRGGGFRHLAGTTSFLSTTIAANDASTRGGGIRIVSGTVNLQNTVIGENTSPNGRSCSGTIVSQDYNLIESRAGCNITGDVSNSQSNTLAQLAPLADNGGPTLTHALEAGSPAIDAGQTVEAVDQRGFSRDDGNDDMGAFEFGASSNPEIVASGEAEVVETAEAPAESALKTMEEAVRLSPVAPNPMATGRTGTVTFAVRDAEAVEVSLYDATGRRVATLYSGTPLAGQEQTVALDASDLAAGVYVVRLLGETVQATQRVTLVR